MGHLRYSTAISVASAMICGAVLALAAIVTPLSSAGAASSTWERADFADVRLVSAVAATGEGGDLPFGLQFRLADGWKVYWRSPGDAGYPPRVDWAGSENLGDVSWQWPVPKRISIFGLETYGYEHEVVLPFTVTVASPGEPVSLRAEIDALACSDICVPLTATLALDLPAGAAGPTPFTQLIDRWRARVPSDMPGVGLEVAGVSPVGSPKAHSLAVDITAAAPLTAPDGFPEARDGISFGKPDVTIDADGLGARLVFPATVPEGARLETATVTLTLVDGDRFIERTRTVGAVLPGTAGDEAGGDTGTSTILAMLGFALLGGLILNLMPCVLPVLSLKLLGVVGYGGADRGAIRRGFLASAAGIVTSFLALAGLAITLKNAGIAVGWGIQFQQPAFLIVMILLLVGFAANLWGLFEVPLPRALADLGTRAGDAGAKRGKLTGHFLTGAFATLLATPCSAPFLGTALGFAFARGAVEILAIFAAMGVGLAAPYLAVAAVPRVAAALPKPGRWMLHLRRGLGLALAGTAVWLGTVVAAQTLPGIGRDSPDKPTSAAVEWAVFERAAVDASVAAGRVVVVDVTADWCLTCKVNKALVLDTDPVAARLAADDVITLRADWTNPDPAITDYLASFGRYGIPFNAVYGPGAPAGIALPELLTGAAVLDAIERAAGPRTADRDVSGGAGPAGAARTGS